MQYIPIQIFANPYSKQYKQFLIALVSSSNLFIDFPIDTPIHTPIGTVSGANPAAIGIPITIKETSVI